MTTETRPTNDELLERYRKTLRSDTDSRYPQVARDFLAWVGSRPIDLAAVEGWTARRRRERYASGSIAFEWRVIRRLFLANKLEWPFHRGDAPPVNQSEVRAPRLDDETVERIVRAAMASERSYDATLLALSTTYGLRREEMHTMRPENLRNGLLYVETAKHGRQRYHVVPEEIAPWVGRWGFQRPLSLSTISNTFLRLRTEAGFKRTEHRGDVEDEGEGISFHSIRRSLAHHLRAAKLPDNVINSYLRWKPYGSMLDRYSSANEVVGIGRRRAEMPSMDTEVDEQVFAVHPFLKFWKT